MEIKLTQGKVALVSDEDYEYLSQWKWSAILIKGKIWYATRREGEKRFWMHREIMNTPKNLVVDHKNGNGLDNRRENLRNCTSFENQSNRGKNSNNTTGFKGVHFHKLSRKYIAVIKVHNKNYYLGLFKSPEEAALARDAKAMEMEKDFAYLNFQERN